MIEERKRFLAMAAFGSRATGPAATAPASAILTEVGLRSPALALAQQPHLSAEEP